MEWRWLVVGVFIPLVASGIETALAVYLYIIGKSAIEIAISTFLAVFLFGVAICNTILMRATDI